MKRWLEVMQQWGDIGVLDNAKAGHGKNSVIGFWEAVVLEIAQVLRLSPESLKKMVQFIIAKLNAFDRSHAVLKGLRAGFV